MKGFTLIELIVVIVLMAISIAVAAPILLGDKGSDEMLNQQYYSNCLDKQMLSEQDCKANADARYPVLKEIRLQGTTNE